MSWVHLPRDEKSSDPKCWIRGNTKIGPVLEDTTSYLQSKNGVEIRIESVNKDNSHSWVRISHGLNKMVTDLIDKEDHDNEQETSEMKFEEFAWKTNVLAFASRSKAQSKTTKTYSCLLIHKNCTYLWKILDWCRARNLFEYRFPSVKTTEYSFSSWSSTSRRRWSDWILEIKRIVFGTSLRILDIGLMKCGRVEWHEAEVTRKDFNIALTHQDK